MGAVVAIDQLLDSRRVWRGQPIAPPPSAQPTGLAALDAALPSGGWPEAALTELLLPAEGVGELQLLWPTLARLSQGQRSSEQLSKTQPATPSRRTSSAQAGTGGGIIAIVAPPHLPYAPAWHAAGVHLPHLQLIHAGPRDALWAAEQCLRSGACAAVLCWPHKADDRALRRLQVAAETGQCLGFALRDMKAAINPSPAALRIALEARPRQLRVLKCRGGTAPTRPIPFPIPTH